MQVIYDGKAGGPLLKEVLSQAVSEITMKDENVIYLDADLMSCINTLEWARANGSRAIDCGIAEANMVGIAAGLSLTGFRPIIHSFAAFASRRCFDQVFLPGGYGRNGMTVIGSDAGVCAAMNGGTHMPFEDIALYRTIPDATVIDVSDCNLLKDIFPKLVYMDGVKYLRTGRKISVRIYSPDSSFEIGKGNVLTRGGDVAIIACGIMVTKALDAAKLLEADGISATVVDMFTIKPLDRELVLELAGKTGAVVTAENHSVNGGLTEAVCRALSEGRPVPVEHVAVDDLYGQVGSQGFLEQEYGLTAEHIAAAAKKAISRRI